MHIFKKLKVKRIVMLEDEILGNLYQKLPVTGDMKFCLKNG